MSTPFSERNTSVFVEAQQHVHRGVPPARRPLVALAGKVSRRRNQWHVGVVYADREQVMPRLLHLAWDHHLRDQPIDEEELGWERGFIWIEIPLLPEKVHALVHHCRKIAERVQRQGQEVRYSIRYCLGSFDPETGKYMPGESEHGLTCATCVLAVCLGIGVELVAVDTWPPREEDAGWISRIVDALRKDDPDHASKVERDGLCARFRPTEVIGACLEEPLKVPFARAMCLAEIIQNRHDELFPVGSGSTLIWR